MNRVQPQGTVRWVRSIFRVAPAKIDAIVASTAILRFKVSRNSDYDIACIIAYPFLLTTARCSRFRHAEFVHSRSNQPTKQLSLHTQQPL